MRFHQQEKKTLFKVVQIWKFDFMLAQHVKQ